MGRIQSNIGIITGVPIGDTVDALMALAAKPRDLLLERTENLQTEQLAVTELSALLLTVRYVTDNLGKEDLYDKRAVTSSNPSVLSASVVAGGQPPMGAYQFTPLQTVQSQQLLSSGFESDTNPLGGGKLTFRFGRDVEDGASLDLFDAGNGVVRGRIRITDRSGARAEIDLTTVETVDDVLEAINAERTIDVTAVAHGDQIRLIDNTGQTTSNLRVQEVNGGTTAASLGLAGIDVSAGVADGKDMVRLFEGLDLDLLNDGSGVRLDTVFAEITYKLRDGTSGTIDFSKLESESTAAPKESTLGDVLNVINATAPGKLKAEIASDGDRLVITDMTEGDGTFQLIRPASWDHVRALEDLGLDGREAVDGVITGRRLLGGAKTVLISSLNGGQGFGQLGALELSDRNGVSDTVNLAGAETLEDVIDRINRADVGIVAKVNQARNGIQLVDTTGGQAANLIVASADTTNTAQKLGLAVDDDVAAKNSGDLHLQVMALNTGLDDLNGGAGVARGSFLIQDSTNRQAEIDLRDDEIQTIGDVIEAIRRLPLQVYAEINETGDGIRLVDYGNGPGGLVILEGDSTTAQDLNLFQHSTEAVIDDKFVQVIDGSMTRVIELDDDTQQIALETKLDELNHGSGVARGTFSILDSSGRYARLDLAAENIQTVGELIDAINQLDVGVEAEINVTEDGILIKDVAGGERTLRIFEGNSTTASDLHLLNATREALINGQPFQVVNGRPSSGVRTLEDLRQAINELNAGVTATTFLDGSSRPFRLSLISNQAGKAGQLVVDTSQLGFSMEETVAARDAKLVFGSAENAAAGVLVSSSSNTFRGVLPGVTLQVQQASSQPVTVTIARSDTDLVANVKAMVENYNRFRAKLSEVTAYDVETDTRSVLTGDSAALRLDTELSQLISGRFLGVGSIQSLAEVGIVLKNDGTLQVDESKLKARYAADPEAVKQFFSTEEFGVSDKFADLIEQMSGQDVSLLANRYKVLRDKIDRNAARIEYMNERLTAQQNQLFLQFYRMELAIAELQAGLSALDAIQPMSSSSSTSS
ncbi:MAG: flagellar filament capping protein FliD [Pirellulales bacterium]|nr:flagellar filament capping protein FliD [Pirellulales bacterium]